MSTIPRNNLDLTWWENTQERNRLIGYGFTYGSEVIAKEKPLDFPTKDQILTVLKQVPISHKGAAKTQNTNNFQASSIPSSSSFASSNRSTPNYNTTSSFSKGNSFQDKKFTQEATTQQKKNVTKLADLFPRRSNSNHSNSSFSATPLHNSSNTTETVISLCEDDDWDDVMANVDLEQYDSYHPPATQDLTNKNKPKITFSKKPPTVGISSRKPPNRILPDDDSEDSEDLAIDNAPKQQNWIPRRNSNSQLMQDMNNDNNNNNYNSKPTIHPKPTPKVQNTQQAPTPKATPTATSTFNLDDYDDDDDDDDIGTPVPMDLTDMGDSDLEALKRKLESEIARRQSSSTKPTPTPQFSNTRNSKSFHFEDSSPTWEEERNDNYTNFNSKSNSNSKSNHTFNADDYIMDDEEMDAFFDCEEDFPVPADFEEEDDDGFIEKDHNDDDDDDADFEMLLESEESNHGGNMEGVVFDLVESGGEEFDGEEQQPFDDEEEEGFVPHTPPMQLSNSDETIKRINNLSPSTLSVWARKFPWSTSLIRALREKFGLYEFREQQIEVINCTMSGKDVFVLMPTGGGKSLCYQLPAVLSPGLTIVVSPLVSLIQDQVNQLRNLDIETDFLGAGQNLQQEQAIYEDIRDRNGSIKILYITPEKLSKSQKLQSALSYLHERGRTISRVAIDEAHCVSQWGRDFRPDYKECKLFKQMFPDVPVIALTATATDTVRTDAIHQLGLKNVVQFKTSFNRPNLRYEIRKKKDSFQDMCSWININYRDKCGIVYCLSRKECESLAKKLEENGIAAQFYHGELDPNERDVRQQQWNRGDYQIMVATIAFGMGINKSNVRFVIHYSMPKSVEGYYQESGRAGRDGLIAHTIVYYSYADAKRVDRLLKVSMNIDSRPTLEQRKQYEQNKKNLYSMVEYCENVHECRRVILMRYLGEKFTPAQCNRTCDVCSNPCSVEQRDMSSYAKTLLQLAKRLGGRHTKLQLVDIWRGSKAKAIISNGYDRLNEYGAGKLLPKYDAENLVLQLARDNYLQEETVFNKVHGTSIIYYRFGNDFLKTPYMMTFRETATPLSTGKSTNLQKQQLTNVLVRELKKVQKNFVKDGIDKKTCDQLIKLISVELPTTPQEILSAPYLAICARNLLQRYARKFSETVNKFMEENPEIKNFAAGNVQTLEHHFAAAKSKRGATSTTKKSNAASTNYSLKSKFASKNAYPSTSQRTSTTKPTSTYNSSSSSYGNRSNADNNSFSFTTTGTARRGGKASTGATRTYTPRSTTSTTSSNRQYPTKGTFAKSSAARGRGSGIRAVKPKLANKSFSSVLSRGSYNK